MRFSSRFQCRSAESVQSILKNHSCEFSPSRYEFKNFQRIKHTLGSYSNFTGKHFIQLRVNMKWFLFKWMRKFLWNVFLRIKKRFPICTFYAVIYDYNSNNFDNGIELYIMEAYITFIRRDLFNFHSNKCTA